jgi:hypothetical protein
MGDFSDSTRRSHCHAKMRDATKAPMIGDAIYFVVIWAVTIFLANRLYVIVRHKALNIKGVTYSRDATPIIYWIQMIMIISALILIGGIAVLITLDDTGLLNSESPDCFAFDHGRRVYVC